MYVFLFFTFKSLKHYCLFSYLTLINFLPLRVFFSLKYWNTQMLILFSIVCFSHLTLCVIQV